MNSELITQVAEKLGWRDEERHRMYYDTKVSANYMADYHHITDSGIVALLEWAGEKGWMIWKTRRGQWVAEDPPLTQFEAESLAEALCLARCSYE